MKQNNGSFSRHTGSGIISLSIFLTVIYFLVNDQLPKSIASIL